MELGFYLKRGKLVSITVVLLGGLFAVHGQTSEPLDSLSKLPQKIKLAAIPMINYNRSFGLMVGGMGSMYYRMSKKDTISPSSSTMLMGMYSTTNTYMALGVQQFYLKEDRWRVKVVAGFGDFFFQYFQGLPNLPPSFGEYLDDNGVWIDYETKSRFLMMDVRRKVYEDMYAGLLYTVNWSDTEFTLPGPIDGLEPKRSANMMSLGYSLLYDSRDHVNYPSKGFFVQFKNRFVREAFGASDNFNQFELAANYFWDIKEDGRSILVSRIFADIATGDVPFQGENFMGRDDMRGYSQGKYRGNQVYDIQAELRQNLYGRFGMVAFLGAGTVLGVSGDNPSGIFLPSAGVGFRYLMIPSEKIHIGLDVGVGKDDWSLTFRIGEAFAR